MKKNFTFILLSLLLLAVGGGSAQTTTLVLDKVNNVSLSDQVYTDGKVTGATVTFNGTGFNGTWSCGLTGADNSWVADYQVGEVHTFTINLSEGAPAGIHFYVAADFYENFNDNRATKYLNETIPEGATSVSYSVSSTTHPDLLSNDAGKGAYKYVWIINQGTSGAKLKISSITRTISTASSVDVPTINPADGTTYDGDLSVTIAKGADNAKVVYSVSGSAAGDVKDAEFTSDNMVLNLTGTGPITVTATGYDGDNASSVVTNTYTYSVASGKTTVSYAIPGEVETEMRKYDFERGDDTEEGGKFSGGKGQSPDDSYADSYNLWLKNNNYGGVDYSSQIYLNLNTSDWPVGTKITLSFYAKGCDDFEVNTEEGRDNGMKIAIQENQGSFRDCAVFTNGVKITKEWKPYVYHATIDNTCSPNRIYFNCGNYKGSFRFDNIIITKTAESATGGSNVFTSDDQVANIGKSEFSSLKEGDYICADVTGSPETIKLVCNGNDYALSQFNGGNLWGVQATAAMVTALSGNDSQFKGHDLTLNGISIYETTAVTETNTGSITKKNNTFVELTRSFTKDMWNTVCLPFVPTAAQANALFGVGYKIAKFTGVSETTLEFTSKDKEAFDFVAGQPYLVKPTENLSNSSPVVLADVNITAKNGATVTHETVTRDGYSFTGTFTTKSFAKGDWATTRFVATDNKLNTPNSTNAMKALRCYFTVPAESTVPAENSARGYAIDGFMDDDVPTDISATLNDNVQTTKVIYNLAGQRVANPTKGLYIVNGQKVVVK